MGEWGRMRRPGEDTRQADIFGVPEPAPVQPRPARPRRPRPAGLSPAVEPAEAPPCADAAPAAQPAAAPAATDIGALAARLTPSELEELAASVSDDGLARLMLASLRQLRRRIGRPDRGRDGKAPASALERAGRQLAAELGREEAEE